MICSGNTRPVIVLESKPNANLLLNLVCTLAGVALIYLGHDYGTIGSNRFYGLLLGLLIMSLGVAALIIGERRRITVDIAKREIRLDVRRRLASEKSIRIPFASIAQIYLTRNGSASDGSVYYDISLERTYGSDVYLMGGCIFEGRMDRCRMDKLRNELMKIVGIVGTPPGINCRTGRLPIA